MGFGVPSLSYRLGVFALDKCKQKKKDCLAFSTDQDNKSSQIFITSLASNSEERFQFKQTFGFSRPYSEVWPMKLTNHSECTNQKLY